MSAESRQCCRRCTPWSRTTGWWSRRGRTGSASRGSTSTGPRKQTSSPSGLNILGLSLVSIWLKCQSWQWTPSVPSKADTIMCFQCVLKRYECSLPAHILRFNLCDVDHLLESNLKFVGVLWMRREVKSPSERISWEEEQRGSWRWNKCGIFTKTMQNVLQFYQHIQQLFCSSVLIGAVILGWPMFTFLNHTYHIFRLFF